MLTVIATTAAIFVAPQAAFAGPALTCNQGYNIVQKYYEVQCHSRWNDPSDAYQAFIECRTYSGYTTVRASATGVVGWFPPGWGPWVGVQCASSETKVRYWYQTYD